MATFYSSKTYLCDMSKFFHNALMQSFREAAEGVLCLPDDDPVSFRHIFQILKSGSLSPNPFRTVSKGQRCEMITDTYLEELAMAWLFADKYDFASCQRKIMKEFTSIVQEQSLVKLSLMTMIYERTLPMSPLRFAVLGKVHSRLEEKANVWDDFSVLHAFDGFFKELYLTGTRYTVQCRRNNWECCLGRAHHEVWHMGDLLGFEEQHKEPELQESPRSWTSSPALDW